MAFHLHQGDCLDILRTIPDTSIDAIVVDPPYGMDYQSSRTTGSKRKPKIANDKRPFIWWLHDAYRVLKDGSAMYSFSDWGNSETFRLVIELAGFTVRSQAIWDRQSHGMGDLNSQLAPRHDVIWFATKGKFKFKHGRPKSIFTSPRISGQKLVHPNEKPVELLTQLVASITSPGDTVLDPFMGSGSTGVACVNTGRHFSGIELDPDYFAIAQQRIATAASKAEAA